jgi:cellulose synthase/poly-beta-1,6-N-acetylglucosamine synthase-like glycosyltransferase
MPPALVSVIIPTYNYGHFVTTAVDSALAQSYPHREIIVVDDGSTDNTRLVLEPYLDRVTYIYQNNQGLSAARNTGIGASKGELIALLDSDDAWHPRKLDLQVRFLREHPDVGLVASELFSDQRQSWPDVDDCATKAMVYQALALEDVVGKARFGPSSAVIRRICLDEVGLFDPTLRCVEDRDMWIRLASRHRLAKLPLPLLWYRLHPQSLSNKAALMEATEKQVLRKAFKQIPGLQGRWLFRRKAFCQAALESSQQFRANGLIGASIIRILWSMLLWPLPLGNEITDVRFLRIRILLNLLLRMLGLRNAGLTPGSTGGDTPPPNPLSEVRSPKSGVLAPDIGLRTSDIKPVASLTPNP